MSYRTNGHGRTDTIPVLFQPSGQADMGGQTRTKPAKAQKRWGFDAADKTDGQAFRTTGPGRTAGQPYRVSVSVRYQVTRDKDQTNAAR